MNIIRWVLCLPIGILAGAVVGLSYIFIPYHGEEGSIGSYIGFVLAGIFSGATTSYVTAYIAPSKKRIIAAVVLVLSIVNLLLFTGTIADDKSYLVFNISQELSMLLVAFLIVINVITTD